MRRDLIIDGQRRPREPELEIRLLDSPSVDLRLMPLPIVLPATELEFFEAGGDWIPTAPMPLE